MMVISTTDEEGDPTYVVIRHEGNLCLSLHDHTGREFLA